MTNAGEVKTLGRYQLLFMLGQGGMGEVHLAKLTGAAGFEKLCIVKTILPQMKADPQFVERFHHEARVLVHLNHSNIAQVYDMGEFGDTLYMAIEYVPGVDLSRVESRVTRQEAVMPVPIALYLGQQVNEALGYAHRKTGPDGTGLGIVHRDVSPQNVMVSYEGEVKVIDFGLAKSAVRSQHTLPQTVMGKLGYMSPEQAMAKSVDHRSDIFSAGIILWEMLAGRPLYGGGTMGEMVAQMAYPNIPPLRSIRPEISPTLEQIVMRALQVDPAARYARADDFARSLNELAVRESLTVGAEEVGNYVRAMCPEEFAAERQLQSKLSVLRRRAAAPAAAPEEEPQAPVEGTFLRPSRPALATDSDMTPAQRALSVVEPSHDEVEAPADPNPGRGRTVVAPKGSKPGSAPRVAPAAAPARGRTVVQGAAPSVDHDAEPASEPIVIPRSKVPLIVAGLVGVLALGAGAYFATRGGDDRPAPIAQPVAKSPVEDPVAPAEPKREPPGTAEEDAGSVVAERGSNPASAAATLGEVEVSGSLLAVRADEGDAIMLLAKGQKAPFQEGDAVLLVGAADEGAKKVPLYARGAVIDVKSTLVRIAFNQGTAPEDVKLFVMKDKEITRPVVVAKRPKVVEPKKDEPVATKTEPVKEPTKEPVKDPVKEPAKEPVAVTEPKRAGISGVIGVSSPSTPGGPIVRIQNTTGTALTNCTIRLTSQRIGMVQTIAANSEIQVKYSDFRADSRPPDANFAQGWSAVYCREGTGYFYTTYVRR